MLVIDYINKHHEGNQSEFALYQLTTRQQVQKWIKKEYIIVDGKLYRPMQKIDVPNP